MLGRKTWMTVVVLTLALAASEARAGWSVGLSIHAPLYGRPCCGPYYYYQPYSAVIVRPAPVYVQPVAVVEPAPVYAPVPVPAVAPAPAPVIARTASPVTDADTSRYHQQLQSAEPRERADGAMQLGRLHAPDSLPTLTGLLANDRSPVVREAAARALGLLGSADALDPLQRAALGDDDREVRHSAAYAADVIRSNLPRR